MARKKEMTEMTIAEVAQTLEYVEALLKVIRSELPHAGPLRGKKLELVAETRFPGRNCDVAADRMAQRIRTAKGTR